MEQCIMADIHILEGRFRDFLDDAVLVNYRVVYHVPIESPKPEVTFPDAVSAVPDIDASELDAIRAGSLFEITKTEIYNSNVNAAEHGQRLKEIWTALKTRTNLLYAQEYKFYGVTLDVD